MEGASSDPDSSPSPCGYLLILFSIIFCIALFPLTPFFLFHVVAQYERAVIFRLGNLREGGAVGPGLVTVLPFVDDIHRVDLRTVSLAVPPQELLTQDSVTVSVDAVVFYRICCAVSSVCSVDNVRNATGLLAQTTLRNTLGTKSLSEILAGREVSSSMRQVLDQATDPWGVLVERVEVKDVRLARGFQRAMAAEAEALRLAGAKVISAQGELNASKALKKAGDVLTPTALNLRYLRTLATIAAEQESTILFPMPIDLVNAFDGK